MAQDTAKALTSSLGKLQISQKEKPSKKKAVADSWEDEADDGDLTPVRPSTAASDIPGPPPPTPSSPTAAREQTTQYQSFPPFDYDGAASDETSTKPRSRGGEERRPDKTTSVASRLIAAGIGQKAPKRTQEQREYDQAMKLQEKKKRDEAKAEEERKKREKEQAQKDIWGD